MPGSTTSAAAMDETRPKFTSYQESRKQDPKSQNAAITEDSNQGDGINICVQILLAACSMGVEMCGTFSQIFTVLYLQFFDVPMELISLNGVICGATSIVILPIVGWFSDKGSNPVVRKLMTMVLCLLCYSLGLTGIIGCAISKIIIFSNIDNNVENNTADIHTFVDQNWTNIAATTSQASFLKELDMSTASYSGIVSSVPPTAYVAIACFALNDLSFDISMALSRAFILECIPSTQHTRLLLVTSAIQSFSGLTFAFVCTIKLSDFLNSMFHVNGTAATIIFQAAFLATFTTFGFACTMITGYTLLKKRRSLNTPAMEGFKDKVKNFKLPKRTFKESDRHRKMWWRKSAAKPTSSDLENTDAALPLLTEDRVQPSNYLSASLRSAQQVVTEGEGNDASSVVGDESLSSSFTSKETRDGNGEFTPSYQAGLENSTATSKNPIEELFMNDSVPASAIAGRGTFLASYSYSMSLVKTKFERDTVNSKRETSKGGGLFSKRLVILLVASFLSIGSMLCGTLYTSNAVTIDIYHGDPLALPGTEAFFQYQKGLSAAAWGNFYLYITFSLFSLCNSKIISLIGEKLQFVVCHFIFISLLVCLLVLKTDVQFFIAMAASGLNRACVFTLPYVLANKYTQVEGEPSSTSSKRGKVMTLIGIMIPLHFLFLSTLMGPLIAATGNVWVPTIYSVANAGLATVIFGALFFVEG